MALTRTPKTTDGQEAQLAKKKLGKYLKRLREDAGLTQLDVARVMNEDYPNFVSQIECGRVRLPAAHFHAVAKLLKVPPAELAKEHVRLLDPDTYRALFGGR